MAIMQLKQYRRDRGLSLAAMAQKIGLLGRHAGRTVQRWEDGVRMPRPADVRRIEEATGGKVGPVDFYHAGQPMEVVQ